MIKAIYLRNEPTTDATALKYAETYAANLQDVVAYADAEATERVAVWPWYITKPAKGCNSVMLNCARRPAVWI